ncbi:MAG TPA: twin-arginine translocase subunit TatB [Mizugakiibacter sp.]|nr:twin-arginine translocase subunit TatB [Mizugakiibacter sp.]
MFDIGFWELALIMVVALMVIGPDRLPGLARTAGRWIGKAQAKVHSVKADIDRELAAGELKKSLANGEADTPDLFAEFNEIAEQAKCNFHMDASGQMQTPEDTTTSTT